VYAVVRKIARLASDGQSAESLAADVFSTFPSLYHLLPAPDFDAGFELFDVEAWPNSGPRPVVPLLYNARTLGDRLARGDERFAHIIGAGQETVTRATRQRDQFIYTITRQGDGTVPLACAELPGARTYYTTVAHSELARDATVAHAIADVLGSGQTRRLQSKWSNRSRAEARISDRDLRNTHTQKVDWVHMEPDARQDFLRNLNEPPQLTLRVPKPRTAPKSKRVRKPTKVKRKAKVARRAK
jgi:hypothetical protein